MKCTTLSQHHLALEHKIFQTKRKGNTKLDLLWQSSTLIVWCILNISSWNSQLNVPVNRYIDRASPLTLKWHDNSRKCEDKKLGCITDIFWLAFGNSIHLKLSPFDLSKRNQVHNSQSVCCRKIVFNFLSNIEHFKVS